jgi:hypothetical protein
MDIEAFHLPPGVGGALRCIAAHDGVRALAPELEPADVAAICDALLEARRALGEMPSARVIGAIDAAARRLRDPDEPAHGRVLQALGALTGYSPPMAAVVLERMSRDWLRPALEELITAELGGAAAIEGFQARPDGTRVRAVAAPLGLHVFAGNVPGVSVTSVVRALLVRSAVFGKSAIGEPVLAPAFARLLAEVDAEVGACVAIAHWAGGDAELEAGVLARAGLVVHYGGEEAIASLRSRAPATTRFVDHGPKLSFIIVDSTAAHAPDSARDAAAAVAVFDQQGCVSPQFACVVGSEADAAAFAAAVAAGLDRVAPGLPRGRIDAGEAAAIRELRTSAEFRGIAGRNVQLWEGADLGWTVVLDPDAGFGGSCLNRTLIVRRADSLDAVVAGAAPFGRYLQTVGLGGFEGEREAVAARLAEIGVTRVTPIAAMPWPPVAWHHDGRGPLRELVRWIDLES